jgi:hypothetical protein
MLRESQAAVVARNEKWAGSVATEPYEAGWAGEAIFFVRALHDAKGAPTEARVELSPDGMHWVAEGTTFALPRKAGEVTFARVGHFGTWLRVAADLPAGAELTVLVTVHAKA